ncbi:MULTISPECIES: hypothetical protein [Runella]|uniref:Uncharacterized protein n=1 Tax=Runella defluvii TaxID=370973 RepID=A0A7W6EQY8_9BACT|nr:MULTISPECIES: hypothetical protein [Runella]MCA0232234.1 hypothetical protein [Bacteroidota bacterium]HAK77147.1 hypothetical protein [Runella sp.]AYQ35122.1 hypothetical protein DTQ70_24470 [Runella sp. SP2]MBB3838967.1 hypothetical protein [Runella defluvii]HAO48880.1 hypothetical protein [Runella sp.]
MIQLFTPDDVIRYVYEETTEDENVLIEDALIGDQELLEFYLDALEMKSLMNKIERTPSNSVVSNILAYSQNYKSNQSVA